MRELWLSNSSRRTQSTPSKPRSPNCKRVCLVANGNGEVPRRRGWPNVDPAVVVVSSVERGGMVAGPAPPCPRRRWWSRSLRSDGVVRVAVCPLQPRARRPHTRKSNGRCAWCGRAKVGLTELFARSLSAFRLAWPPALEMFSPAHKRQRFQFSQTDCAKIGVP